MKIFKKLWLLLLIIVVVVGGLLTWNFTQADSIRRLGITSPSINSVISGRVIFRVSATGLSSNDSVSLMLAGTTRYGMKYAQVIVPICQNNGYNAEYFCEVDTTKLDKANYSFVAMVSSLNLYSGWLSNIEINNGGACQAKTSCLYNFKAGCGTFSDGCGNQIDCGGCKSGLSCITGKCLNPVKKDKTTEITSPRPGETISGKATFRIRAYNLTAYEKIEIRAINWGGTYNAISNNTVARCTSVGNTYAQYTCEVDTSKMTNGYYDFHTDLTGPGGWSIYSVMVPNVMVNNQATCQPKTCASGNFQCGYASDGCGLQINCGNCASGSECVNNKCEKPAQAVNIDFVYPSIDYVKPTRNNVKASGNFTFLIAENNQADLYVVKKNVNGVDVSEENIPENLERTGSAGKVVAPVFVTNTCISNRDPKVSSCLTIDTTKLKNGTYKFYIKDADGLLSDYIRYLIIENKVPSSPEVLRTGEGTINIISPLSGATVKRTVTLSPEVLPTGESTINIISPISGATVKRTVSFKMMLTKPTIITYLYIEGIKNPINKSCSFPRDISKPATCSFDSKKIGLKNGTYNFYFKNEFGVPSNRITLTVAN